MSKRCCFQKSQLPVLLLLIAGSACCQFTSQATVAPNEFRFSSAQYDVSADATNAVITIQFSPGHRGVYGWVDYSVRCRTATANGLYSLVSGTLAFSGYGPRTITVPINGTSMDTEIIELFLSPSQYDQSAIITRSNAVVRIIGEHSVPAPVNEPKLNGALKSPAPMKAARKQHAKRGVSRFYNRSLGIRYSPQ